MGGSEGMTPLGVEELAELKACHQPYDDGNYDDGNCRGCDMPVVWPCTRARLIAMVEVLQAENERIKRNAVRLRAERARSQERGSEVE